jgi:hypothetical protein
MPCKKCSIPLCQHYSNDINKSVIYQAFTLGKKSMEIAMDLEMPL